MKLSELKWNCREFEQYMAVNYDYEIAKRERPNFRLAEPKKSYRPEQLLACETFEETLMPQQGVKVMTKESPLDRHIHLHIHEILPGRWLRPKSKVYTKIFTRILPGLVLGTGIMGALWFQWWR